MSFSSAHFFILHPTRLHAQWALCLVSKWRNRPTNHARWIVCHIKHFLFTGCWGRIKILLERLLDLCCTSSGLRSCQARTMVSLRLSLKTKMPDEAVTNHIPSLLLPHLFFFFFFFLTLNFLPFIFVLFLRVPFFCLFPHFPSFYERFFVIAVT